MRGIFVTGTDTEVGKSVLAAAICAAAVERGLRVAAFKPVVIAGRPGLGTINHSLLTIECARAIALRVQAVVLTPWPAEATAMERSNRETIERFAEVPVLGLPPTDPDSLAQAGAGLPVSD